jgi:hypothetical protein
MALETFFEYSGRVGEGSRARDYTFTAYRVPGSTTWFMKGRCMIDFDGAPNCYHPNNHKLLPIRDYPTVDIMAWDGVLDALNNARGGDGSWASVVLKPDGQPLAQGDDDPFPGYFISTTPLQNDQYPTTDPHRYADARIIPYFALPAQILAEKGRWFTRKSAGHTGNFGDFVTAINLNTNDCGHAVIGDTGDKPEFGEVSYALGKSINMLTGNFEPEVLYIIYPHTGSGQFTMPDPEVIQEAAADQFRQFGGMDEVARVLALM